MIDAVLNTINTWVLANPSALYFLIVWQIVWMGIALWISARKNQKIWFIVFLLIHLVGVLEILYIFWFSKIGSKKNKPKKKRK